jgi:thiamine biosynthesis lipoprotein
MLVETVQSAYDARMNKHLWPLFAVFLTACAPATPEPVIVGQTMGTTYNIRFSGCPQDDCSDHLSNLISTKLSKMNQRLSHFDETSELSQFNLHAGKDWFPVSSELVNIVAMANEISARTDGAFDITVAGAVDAWGFGAADHGRNSQREPNEKTLEAARAATNYKQLNVRSSPPALSKTDPLLSIDLSAIAKGYAVDQIAFLLEEYGIRNYVVEIGGELRTAGTRADGKPWRIGIEQPDPTLPIEFIIIPRNAAVATSGDYRNFYMLDERRISHTIDPVTARPVSHDLASVSVIAPSAALADALATALMVLGAERGHEFARAQNIAALFITRLHSQAGETLRSQMTPAFEPWLLKH